MQIYGAWVSVLEGAFQPRSHCDFHKQKGLPCLLLQNRHWRVPSVKDIKKEQKKHGCQGWALQGFLLVKPIFYENLWWSLCLGEHYVSSPASSCFTDTFQSKNENLQVKLNGWGLKTNKIQSHVVGLLACYRRNTNEAIWPKRQVNEECWLKKESRVQDKRPFM